MTSWGNEKCVLVSISAVHSEQVSNFQISEVHFAPKVLSTVSLFFDPEHEHLTSLRVVLKIKEVAALGVDREPQAPQPVHGPKW